MILLDYATWQWWQAPAWLAQLAWNLHRFLFRSFSVKLLLRTLIAPWRRDQLSYSHMPLQAVLHNLALNLISRVIGAIIRSITLLAWLIAATAITATSVAVLIAFICAPLIIIALIIGGLLSLAG